MTEYEIMPRPKFEDEDYNLDVGDPPKELLEFAREKWGETDETRPIKLNELRTMIQEQEEIEPDRTDDSFLLRFLRARNFHVDKAYELLVNYTQFKEDHPDFHEGVHPVDHFEHGEEDIYCVLPYREQTGRRIMIYKLGNWQPSTRPILELFRATLTLLELGILEQRAQILGGICIFDLSNIGLSHAWQISPSVASNVIALMVTSFPLKVHALHIIFESWAFDIMFNFFKPLLNSKMKEKLFFHGSDIESLHKHIEPKYLPKKYGGIRSNKVRYKKWIEGFRSNEYIMDQLHQLGYLFRENELTTPMVDNSDSASELEEDNEE